MKQPPVYVMTCNIVVQGVSEGNQKLKVWHLSFGSYRLWLLISKLKHSADGQCRSTSCPQWRSGDMGTWGGHGILLIVASIPPS